MSNELTDVRCSCGDEYPADSYDAGFIAGSGMCQNCDAALPPKDICTCPSGNGSLRHPCPAHPAVEQAGGDERDFQAEGAQEVPSPVSQEYDRHLISLLRKGEALPGHQEEAADEIERLRDWNDHLNNTVLPNILNPTFLMLMKGGERLLDLCTKDGEFIGVSLNDMKDVFDWMVTHARIAPDQAALAQPSPAQAEAEQPEIVAFRYRCTNAEGEPLPGWFYSDGAGTLGLREPLMAVSQHERIVGELRAVIAQLRQHKNDYMDSGQETYRALQNEIREREAEIARLDGLVSGRTAERDAALAEVNRLRESKGDPSGSFDRCMRMMYERDENAKRLDAALARVAELEAKLSDPTAVHQWQFSNAWFDGSEEVVLKAGKEGSPIRTLYTAPPAQAQQLHDLDKQCRDDVARALGLRPSQERGFAWSYLLASINSCVKASEDAAQAQHSAPEVSGIGRDTGHPRAVVLYLRKEPTDDDLRAIHDALRSLAAAPGKEGV
ncbi:hypothetical protein JQS64_09155 [Pseudomonas aeruginosa]|uniref:hypothetical protein n=1 Tax=Pseudomonas aeruginosa TaxID=287 RepID=UPI00193BD2E1|nr:hypothetical protein [Pseudomonas aeruginosa]MBM2516511.1 hypothetical protein [Pseudomonas aeruginosa]